MDVYEVEVVLDYLGSHVQYCQEWLVEKAVLCLLDRLGDRIDALRRVESEIQF